MTDPRTSTSRFRTQLSKHLASVLLLAVATNATTPAFVRAGEPTLSITAMTSRDWHSDMEKVLAEYKTYKFAVENRNSDLAEQMLSLIDRKINSWKTDSIEATTKAETAMKVVQRSVEEASKARSAPANASHDNLEAYRVKAQSQVDSIDALKQANQAIQDAVVARMRLVMLTAYTYATFPPSNDSRESRTKAEAENNLQLKQMWNRPELREAMRQSWKNLMKEVYFLGGPEYPFPFDD